MITDKEAVRKKDWERKREIERQTDRQTERQRHRYIYIKKRYVCV